MSVRSAVAAWSNDLQLALRAIRRAPSFGVAAISTLSLGIAVNSVMFSVVDRLMFRAPELVTRPAAVGRLFYTREVAPGNVVTQRTTSYPEFAVLSEEAAGSIAVAGYRLSTVSVGSDEESRDATRAMVTSSYFALLGIRPALGRFFRDDEDRPPNGEKVAVLSSALWRQAFGADAAVVGKTIRANKLEYFIIGVAPEGFTGIDLAPIDFWVPLSSAASEVIGGGWDKLTSRNVSWLQLIARLRPGVSGSQASAKATLLFRRGLSDAQGNSNRRPPTTNAGAAPDRLDRAVFGPLEAGRAPRTVQGAGADVTTTAWLLYAMSAVVLIIALVSTASLMIARASQRAHEMAIRSALGGSRVRIAQLMFAEAIAISIAATAIGIALTVWGNQLVIRLVLPGTAPESVLDSGVLGVMLLSCVSATLIVGLIPAMYFKPDRLVADLNAHSRGTGAARSPLQSFLIVGQASLSVVLLISAGLFSKSLHRVVNADLGLDTKHVIAVSLPSRRGHGNTQRVAQFYHDASQQVRNLSGVVQVATASSIPFRSSTSVSLSIPGSDSLPRVIDGGPYVVGVSADYFDALGIPVVAGRPFVASDAVEQPRTVIVNSTMARLFWPGRSAIDRCIQIGGVASPCSQVVGVVQDARRSDVRSGPVLQYYVPLSPQDAPSVLFVRTQLDAELKVQSLQRFLQASNLDIPRVDVESLQSLIEPQMQPWRLGAAMLSLFGALALMVTMVGLYGLIGYEMAGRQKELGVRRALGSTSGAIRTLALRRGLTLVAGGSAIGICIALVASPLIQPFLFDTSPRDWSVVLLVAAVMIVTTVLAVLAPAIRASRADPMSALRLE